MSWNDSTSIPSAYEALEDGGQDDRAGAVADEVDLDLARVAGDVGLAGGR